MINFEAKTNLSVSEVCKRIKSYFGEEGLGLKITEETQSCLSFEGGGGYVTTTVCQEGKETKINLKSKEIGSPSKKFSCKSSIGRRIKSWLTVLR